MRDLPLNALRAFALVHDTGGVRAAARVLQVTHSAVSRHLRELEGWLGVPLLEPSAAPRTLALTAQGRELARAASAALHDLERAATGVRERHHSSSVVLTATPSFASRWLLPRLSAFQTAFSWVELSLVVEQRVSEPTAQGADLAIRMGEGEWAGVACEPLMEDRLFPVMSPALWEAVGRPSDPDALLKTRLIHDRDPYASWELWRNAHGPAGLDIRSGPRFASSDLVLRAAEEGLGVALARGRLSEAELISGRLVRPFGHREVVLPAAYWLVQPESTLPTRAAVGAVMAWLRSAAAGECLSPTASGRGQPSSGS